LIHVDPNPQDAADLEVLAAKLEATGAYRVLRKLAPWPAIEPPGVIGISAARAPGDGRPMTPRQVLDSRPAVDLVEVSSEAMQVGDGHR